MVRSLVRLLGRGRCPVLESVGARGRHQPALPGLHRVMLANTMFCEAYEHGGKLAGLITVLGFGVSVLIILLERA